MGDAANWDGDEDVDTSSGDQGADVVVGVAIHMDRGGVWKRVYRYRWTVCTYNGADIFKKYIIKSNHTHIAQEVV